MQLITEAQELTDTWANLGGVIDMRSFNGLSLFFGLDINNSENLQFRAIYKRSLNDQDNYEATIGELTSGDVVLSPKVYELGVDTDGNYSLKITTNNTAPYLQIQVQVLTEGATAGEILTADYFTSHFIDVNASEGGGGGGTPSSLELEVNGTPNGSQAVLDLVEGTGITITDGGTGTVTIEAEAVANVVLNPAPADGTFNGITITGTAGATLAFGDLVYLAAADSRWELADADSATTAGGVVIGMCVLAAAADGSATNILLQGTIQAASIFPTFTVGAPVYAGTTAGDVQVAAPNATDDVVQVVGFGLTADILYFNPSNDYITIV